MRCFAYTSSEDSDSIGHKTLPITCPICLHEPVKSEDCKPNKALRITIKAFLKKKTMDREAAAKKELPKKAPTPAIQPATKSPSYPLEESISKKVFGNEEIPAEQESNLMEDDAPPAESTADIPKPSVEVSPLLNFCRINVLIANIQTSEPREIEAQESTGEQMKPVAEAIAEDVSTNDRSAQGPQHSESDKVLQSTGPNGTNMMAPNMPTNGMMDVNQMMQYMPNGMPNGMMSTFPNMIGKLQSTTLLYFSADLVSQACPVWQWIR